MKYSIVDKFEKLIVQKETISWYEPNGMPWKYFLLGLKVYGNPDDPPL